MPKFVAGIVSGIRIFSALCLFAMMVLTFVDVVGRYFFSPIFGAAEMIQFLLALSIFSALGLASAKNAHIEVDIFVGLIDKRMSLIRRGLVRVLSVIAFALIAFQLGDLTVEALETGRRTIVLEWMFWPLLAVCALLSSVALLVEFVRFLKAILDRSRVEDAL